MNEEPGEGRCDRLLAAVAVGDQRAFAELYDLIVDDAVAIVRTIRPGGAVDEVLRAAMLEIWRTAPRLGGPARSACLLAVYRTASEAPDDSPTPVLERRAMALGLVCRARLGAIATALGVSDGQAAQLLSAGLRRAAA